MRSIRLALLALIALAYPVAAAELLPVDRPVAEAIDHYVDARLAKASVTPTAQIDDYNLIRRLTLDLVGRIPTPREAQDFVQSTDPKKREQLVDRLMASPAFVRYQASQFEAMLAGPSSRGGALRDYLTRALGDNRPWDQIFRELLLPNEDNPKTKGSSEYLKVKMADVDKMTVEVSVAFFGVNVSCAQCHDHPLVSDWKQDHFFGMKSFFARSFDNGGFLAEREFGTVKFKPRQGEEKTAKMMFLTGATVETGQKEATKDQEKKERELFEKLKKEKKAPPAPAFSARAKLVEVALQSKESEYFSRSIANRLWHRFMGLGLVMPLDQMHSENKPSHPELLSWLARDIANHKYDLRPTIRGIVLSKTYSRSSKWTSESATPQAALFAVGRLKPLTPNQMATSLRLATIDPANFEKIKPDELDKRIDSYESASRGLASNFPYPADDLQIGVNEALLFSNSGALIRDLLGEGNDKLLTKAKSFDDPAKAVDLIARTVLCRPATADEQKALVEYISRRGDRLNEAYRQVIWALLSGAEFRFNY
jgi:hypothetical protein